jgi:hypothetical protein
MIVGNGEGEERHASNVQVTGAMDRRARHMTVQRGLGSRQKKGFNY